MQKQILQADAKMDFSFSNRQKMKTATRAYQTRSKKQQ